MHAVPAAFVAATLAVAGAGSAVLSAPSPVPAPAYAVDAGRVVVYRLPVRASVVRPFVAPLSAYGPGHRGVDLAARAGAVVHAAAVGVVRFAGPVAGRGVVVLAHPDGVLTEYEPVTPLVRAGAVVAAGAAVGVVRGRHAGCAGSCLHWGARRDGRYFDPLLLLKPLGPVALIPWSGPAQARG